MEVSGESGKIAEEGGGRRETLDRIRSHPEIPVLIIGAGINGAGLFRELALQGIDALLIDKADFMSGASAASSRMIHGGLRYLENREVRLVKESLKERDLLLKNAPHYVKPLATTIPVFRWLAGTLEAVPRFLGWKTGSNARGALIVKMGLTLYELFAGARRALPGHFFSSRRKALAERPLLNSAIVCTATYYDAWIAYPERLGLELVKEACAWNPGSAAVNYLSLHRVSEGSVLLKDNVSGEELVVRPQAVVNATGAWIDFTNKYLGFETTFIGGTKGSHIVLDNPDLYEATRGQMLYYENKDGRICILFPFHGKVLAGSTDLKISDPEKAVCRPEEVDYILGSVRQVFPALHIDPSQIVFRFCGVRPLPFSKADLTARISRDHSIETIGPSGIASSGIASSGIEPSGGPGRPGIPATPAFPVYNLVGGKWTTFRAFAEQAADKIMRRLGYTRQMSSAGLAIGGGRNFPRIEREKEAWIERLGQRTGIAQERLQCWLERYGTLAEEIAVFSVRQADGLPPDGPLVNHPLYTRREIMYLIEKEYVVHLSDLVLRRTNLAISVELTHPLLLELAGILASCLDLSEQEKEAEIGRTVSGLEKIHGMVLTTTKS